MRRTTSNLCLFLGLVTAGCEVDDNKVSWFFVSNPSGAGLTAGVFIGGSSGSQLQWIFRSGQNSGGPVALKLTQATDRGGPGSGIETFWFATSSDCVVHQHADGVDLNSPALPRGRLRLPPDTEVELNTDSATLIELTPPLSASLTKRWLVANGGNLLIVERSSGVESYLPHRVPEYFPPGTEIQASGISYLLRPTATTSRLLTPPPPGGPETQMEFIEERESLRFFDANGEPSAELPASGIDVQPGGQGLLLLGSYPRGVPGVLEEPFTVLLPLHNHNLVILRGF